MLVTAYKVEFTSWKTIAFAFLFYMTAYFRLYYFFKSTRHIMLSHTKFQIGINICHRKFSQCIWIEPHSSSVTYVENSTSNFRQFVQICCREEEREYWQMQIFLRFTQTQKLSKLNWNILLLTLSVSGSFYIKYPKRASGFLISIRLSN